MFMFVGALGRGGGGGAEESLFYLCLAKWKEWKEYKEENYNIYLTSKEGGLSRVLCLIHHRVLDLRRTASIH